MITFGLVKGGNPYAAVEGDCLCPFFVPVPTVRDVADVSLAERNVANLRRIPDMLEADVIEEVAPLPQVAPSRSRPLPSYRSAAPRLIVGPLIDRVRAVLVVLFQQKRLQASDEGFEFIECGAGE